MCIALVLLAAQASPAFGSDRFRELTIREIYAADHPRPNWETSWQFAAPLGDHNRDGQMDFSMAGVGLKPNYYGDELLRMRSGLSSSQSDRYNSLYWSVFHPFGDGPEGYRFALLTSPSGPRVAILNVQAELTLWDLDSRTLLGVVQVPPPPIAGLPGADVLTSVTGDTDVDADGWSDLFFMDRNGGYGIVGVISGRTLQPLWQHLQQPPAHLARPVPNLDVAGRPDFDQDSVPDFLFGFESFYGGWADYRLGVLSGATGALLWERTLVTTSGSWATAIPDVTHDGVPDVVMGVGQRVLDTEVLVQGMDGATGALIWTRTQGEVVARIPPLFATLFLTPAVGWCQISPFARASTDHEIWLSFAMDDGTPWTYHPRNASVIMDVSDGRVLDTVLQPRELQPWRQLIPGDRSTRPVFPLGDVDRDGLIEYAQPVYASDVNDPNIPGDPYHLVIYGQNTLIGPPEAAPGEPLSVEVWIPSAPGHETWLLASTSLESEAGLELDGWRTRLGPSALRALTVTTKPSRTTLDARGRATLKWTVPAWPRLSGEKLFLRAIVEVPGTDEIWTMSSLEVVPVR